MKQLNLSLTDGFKLRSLIKRKIGIVNSDINSLPVSYDPDLEGKKIEFLCGKYGSVNQMIDLCLKLQETLGYLNEKIDKANIDVRPLLDKTETLNAQNSTVGRILSCIQMNAQSVKKEFNPVTGVYDVTELSQTFADGKINELKELGKTIARQIHELEEKVSDLNGKTKFDIEIDEAIYDFIYDL